MRRGKTHREIILAGDIGGTKTVLALFRHRSGSLEAIREKTFRSREYSGMEQLLARFWDEKTARRVEAMCLGVAGPVRNGQCKTTNLPWFLDEKALAKSSGVKTVRLINDLAATAFGMLFVSEAELAVVNPGNVGTTKQNRSVIAAGTGLGEALLCWNGNGYIPVASEGGHADFAPQGDREVALLGYLRAKYGHVSYERILSGPGILDLYQFLRESGLASEPQWLRERLQAGDPSQAITEIGLERGHPLCTETLELFSSIYGAEAGNLALKTLSLGGVYIGGGIAPKIIDKLRDGSFMRRFLDKGRYAELLGEIPVAVSMNPRTALIGAANYALQI